MRRICLWMLVLVLLVQSVGLSTASAITKEEHHQLQDAIMNGEEFEYLIQFIDVNEGKSQLKKQSKEVLTTYSRFPYVMTTLNEWEAAALSQDPNVVHLEQNHLVYMASESTEYNLPSLHVSAAHQKGLLGEGVKVGILDTGINNSLV